MLPENLQKFYNNQDFYYKLTFLGCSSPGNGSIEIDGRSTNLFAGLQFFAKPTLS